MRELWRLSATEAVALLKRREVSPLELIDAAEARIEATNPKINAFVTLCYDRAREHAQRIMKENKADAPAHYLHGLPIAVKDGTDVAGVRCTSGSRIYADRIAPASDIVVQRLEANGAVVIGKSNLPEFAAGGNTFNDVFGATLNPWDMRMSASGSSGGSAAALAAGQVWLATGGDFGGSIRTPSSFCSTTGLRPSPGMVPRTSQAAVQPAVGGRADGAQRRRHGAHVRRRGGLASARSAVAGRSAPELLPGRCTPEEAGAGRIQHRSWHRARCGHAKCAGCARRRRRNSPATA